MSPLLRYFIRIKEAWLRFHRGQSMAEYTLVLAAIAIAVFVAYTATGQSVNTMVSWQAIDNDLLGS